ncbi:hypothetical protein [Amycolatopsis sp. Hca4]|uniref:hypothetical protein n=1 Tax=Amycolatopsis sp. Hca4 TaxID=2742131 RepID=UPI001590EF65|nr:hypothetical protein [Amycolatopsis sp. Hca4]QKV75389.1 hypothetical protein HUT10_17625 [Amycolatopsis sp. Hca4]
MSEVLRADEAQRAPAEKAAALDDVLAKLDARLKQVIQLTEQLVEMKLSAK